MHQIAPSSSNSRRISVCVSPFVGSQKLPIQISILVLSPPSPRLLGLWSTGLGRSRDTGGGHDCSVGIGLELRVISFDRLGFFGFQDRASAAAKARR